MGKWKFMLRSGLEQKVVQSAHTSLGPLGLDKCINQTVQSLHMKKPCQKNLLVYCLLRSVPKGKASYSII